MSREIELSFSLKAEDFQQVQDFRYRERRLNILQRILLPLGNKIMWRKIKRSEDPQRPSKYAFNESGVTVSDSNEVQSVTWDYFTEVFDYGEGYVFLGRAQQILIIVPKRVFPEELVHTAFRALIHSKLGLKAPSN